MYKFIGLIKITSESFVPFWCSDGCRSFWWRPLGFFFYFVFKPNGKWWKPFSHRASYAIYKQYCALLSLFRFIFKRIYGYRWLHYCFVRQNIQQNNRIGALDSLRNFVSMFCYSRNENSACGPEINRKPTENKTTTYKFTITFRV